ncbi:MAG TPA: hypothetical protein VGN64_03605 [Dyadobacter sp.]|jgi:hypothetical protein|nr:hypothetical protein [Dyadobacter sp.]
MDGLPWATVQRMLIDAPSYESPKLEDSKGSKDTKNFIAFDDLNEDNLADIAAQINKMPR